MGREKDTLGRDPYPLFAGHIISEFDDPWRAEVRSTDRSSRWSFVQSVGQTDADCRFAKLQAVTDTSAAASSF